jgi:poly(glycerol-phosphate) alpha-glucosyltransferase
LQHHVHFVGPQFGAEKAATFSGADAFVLPSLSEGLPMAVLEAWAHGLPVLMTPGCNLPEGFSFGAGVEMTPAPDAIADGLRTLFAMSDAERSRMGERGRRLVAERFAWPRVAEQMLAVYRWVLGQGPMPDSVMLN